MGLYSQTQDFFEYLISIRKLKNYLSFDIELPKNWKIPKKFAKEDKVLELENSNQNKRSYSFVSEYNEIEVDSIVDNIKNIISYNKELELKENLLTQKIQELKTIFENTNLDNLQSLKFKLSEELLTNAEKNHITNREGVRVDEE